MILTERRSKSFWAALVLTGLIAGLFWFSLLRSAHPEFGRISRSSMAEQRSIWRKAPYYCRKMLGLPAAHRPSFLCIGSAPLEWSGGPRKGFIYTNHPLLDDTPLWEFALSPHRRLEEVHPGDLPSEYYGMNDPRGTNAFGADWAGHALRVPAGQVFFARLVTNRSAVYVIRLARQGNGWMRAEYVTAMTPSANDSGQRPEPSRSTQATNRAVLSSPGHWAASPH